MATKLEVEKALYKANLFKMNNIFNSESELVQNAQAFQKYAVEKYVAFHINNGASDSVIEKLLNLGFSMDNLSNLQIFNDAVAKIGSLDKVDVGVYSNVIRKYNLGFSREHLLKEFNAIQTKHFADSVEVRSKILEELKSGVGFSKVMREVKSNMTLSSDCCGATSIGVDVSSCSDLSCEQAFLETCKGRYNITALRSMRGKNGYLEYYLLCDKVRDIDYDAYIYMLAEATKLEYFELGCDLWGCFIFDKTPQGFDYWYSINQKLHKPEQESEESEGTDEVEIIADQVASGIEMKDELSFVKARIASFGFNLYEVEKYLNKRAFVGYVVMRMKEIADQFDEKVNEISDAYYKDNIYNGKSFEVTLDDWYNFLANIEVFGDLDVTRYNSTLWLIDKGKFAEAYNEFINVQRVAYSLDYSKVQSNLHDIITDPHNINWD